MYNGKRKYFCVYMVCTILFLFLYNSTTFFLYVWIIRKKMLKMNCEKVFRTDSKSMDVEKILDSFFFYSTFINFHFCNFILLPHNLHLQSSLFAASILLHITTRYYAQVTHKNEFSFWLLSKKSYGKIKAKREEEQCQVDMEVFI